MKNKTLVLALAILSASTGGGWAAINTVDETTIAAFGTLNQANVGANGNGGVNNFCAPTATMDSFIWLANAYPSIYGNSLMGGQGSWLGAAQLLAGPLYMNTDVNNGTTEGNWVNGKMNYINTYAPGTTIFAGMDSDNTVNRPAWDLNANPTVNFLLQELRAGEDVELGIDPTTGVGHVLTLTGLTWNDADNNGGFNLGDTLTLNTIDPANPLVNTLLTLNPGNPMTVSGGAYNNYLLTGALAESIPEPTSFGLMMLGGLLGLCRLLRWKQN